MSGISIEKIYNTFNKNDFLIDMHIHTKYSPDSSTMLEEILIESSGVLNGLTITDHNIIGNYQSNELKAFEEKYQLKIFTQSVEITSTGGDILAYGIAAVPSKMMEPYEIIDIIHTEGGIAVAAHPFDVLGVGDLVYELNFDAIEINGSRPMALNKQAKEVANILGLPCVGGSDAHTSIEVGSCVTKFDIAVTTIEELIKQVKKGNCYPVFLR